MLDSIESIRIWCDTLFNTDSVNVLRKKLDAVEREVKKRYVELPKDACGLPIRAGDRLYVEAYEGKPIVTAHHITLYEDGWTISDSPAHEATPNLYRHYEPPTVEDVLRDFAYCCEEGATEQSIDEIIAEYAAKLQLKEAE